MASFFNKIDAPDLTQSAKSIETMVQAINDNFQKVFTLPFLKGDPGDEITTRFEYFWDDNKLLTQEAADIFNAVFEQNIFTDGINFDKFILTLKEHHIINDENIETPYWSDTYGPTKEPKILLYYKINAEDTTEEKIGVAQLYYFFDPRITLLSKNLLLSNNGFKDYTCILTTEYNIDENGNYSYEYVKQTGWPTLYYNLSTSQFCWAINGHQTGINAQGVNGKDGIGSKVWLVKLNNISLGSGKNFDSDKKYLENYYTRFSIESVWYPASKKWIAKNEMETTLQKNSGQIFTYDDVFIGYVTGSDPLMEIGLWQFNDEGELENTNEYIKDIPVPDMWIGTLHYDETANENEDKYFVMCNISQNLSVANNNMNLCKMLADIKPSTTNKDPNHLKGLYLRSDDNNNIHAIFNGGHIKPSNTDLYIAPTTLEYMSNSDEITTKYDKNLNIVYNTNISGKTTLSSGLDLLNSRDMNVYCTWGNNDEWGASANASYILTHYHKNKNSSEWILGMSLRINHDGLIICNQLNSNEYALQVNVTNKTVSTGGELTVSSGGAKITGTTIINESEKDRLKIENGKISLYGPLELDLIDSVGISYNKNGESKDLCFHGEYSTKWGGNSSIPIIKSTRYDELGKSSMVNMIHFRNNGTLIYDKLFVGNDDSELISKNLFSNEHTLLVNGKTYIKDTLDVTGNTTLNGTLDVNSDTTLNKAVTLNWNESNYYRSSDTTTTSDLLAKSLLNIGGEGYLRVIFSRNSIQVLSNDKDDDHHYKTDTLNINPLGGRVNIGGATNLNNDLILNSIKHNDTPTYSSNKIVFCRGNLTDGYNDWHMYGNTNGLLEIDCSRNSLSDGKIMTLSCDNSGNKSVNVVGKITGKVDNIEEVNIGMPVGSIILWLDLYNIPENYIVLYNDDNDLVDKNKHVNNLFNKNNYDNDCILNKGKNSFGYYVDNGVINIDLDNETLKYYTSNPLNFEDSNIQIIFTEYDKYNNIDKQYMYPLTNNSSLYDINNKNDCKKLELIFYLLMKIILSNNINYNEKIIIYISSLYVPGTGAVKVSTPYILYNISDYTSDTNKTYISFKFKSTQISLYISVVTNDNNNNSFGLDFNDLVEYITNTHTHIYNILKYK